MNVTAQGVGIIHAGMQVEHGVFLLLTETL
jgi:hypothetical protein